MLVSAISASSSPIVGIQPVSYKYKNNGRSESVNDTTFNSLAPYKKLIANNDMTKIFDSIYEWKGFCHRQIAKGKLDIIA